MIINSDTDTMIVTSQFALSVYVTVVKTQRVLLQLI